jgi:hypothetical protein
MVSDPTLPSQTGSAEAVASSGDEHFRLGYPLSRVRCHNPHWHAYGIIHGYIVPPHFTTHNGGKVNDTLCFITSTGDCQSELKANQLISVPH